MIVQCTLLEEIHSTSPDFLKRRYFGMRIAFRSILYGEFKISALENEIALVKIGMEKAISSKCRTHLLCTCIVVIFFLIENSRSNNQLTILKWVCLNPSIFIMVHVFLVSSNIFQLFWRQTLENIHSLIIIHKKCSNDFVFKRSKYFFFYFADNRTTSTKKQFKLKN